MAAESAHQQPISAELDGLSCDLIGEALDRLADGEAVNVLLAVSDADGNTANFEFADDGAEACLMGAREKVRAMRRAKGDHQVGVSAPRCYAICYEGAVEDEDGTYADALFAEFGERGHQAYSAYLLFDGRGQQDDFRWTDPAPAGEVESLL